MPPDRSHFFATLIMLTTLFKRRAMLAGWIGLILAAITSARGNEFAELRPGPARLLTRWSAEVNSTNAHPEYPRPQLVRSDWLNLNGLWDYIILPSVAGPPPNFAGQTTNGWGAPVKLSD